MKWGLFFILAVAVALVSACVPRKLVVREMADMVETGLPAFEQDDDLEMVQRAFPANIKLLEALLVNDPENVALLVLLSRLYAGYTFGFAEGDLEAALFAAEPAETENDRVRLLKDRVNRYYLKGADYALKALEQHHPGCRIRLNTVTAIDSFLASLTIDDVPPLFWYGFHLGAFVNRNFDSIKTIATAHVAEKAMQRVVELDPAYYHGGAHLFLLTYYASRAPMLGGDLDAARSHYEKLKQVTGKGYLLADVYYARFVLYQQQRRGAYEKMLKRVIRQTDLPIKYRMVNAVARKRAGLYLGAAERLFE